MMTDGQPAQGGFEDASRNAASNSISRATPDDAHSPLQTEKWSLGTRIAFRVFFVYFGVYCCTTQILGSMFPIPKVNIPDLGTLTPLRQMVFWTAAHIFRVKSQLIYEGSGSGDKTFDWVQVVCFLTIAAIATLIWSVLDRERENYVTLHKWFRLFVRFALAGQMLSYGFAKIVPLQMPFPFLTKLLEPYGRFSPMGVLWAAIGASPAYQIFAGCAETLGGLLLFLPRTTLFGALICLADLIQVFMLNMTYDVPVKLLSFHLILLVLFLLAPDLRRIVKFFFGTSGVQPASHPPIARSQQANRVAFVLQLAFGIGLVAGNAYGSWEGWHQYGEGREKPALYGIWDVEEMSIDGQIRSPLLNDYDRWRRVIFDFPTYVAFQRMNDSFPGYTAAYEKDQKTITLSSGTDKNWKGGLTYQREGQEQLTLDGEMGNHKVHMRLRRVDHTKFLLPSRGFHWVQEYPFNR